MCGLEKEGVQETKTGGQTNSGSYQYSSIYMDDLFPIVSLNVAVRSSKWSQNYNETIINKQTIYVS